MLPSRRIPIALADRVKTELSVLVDKGIIAPVDEPTDWVNQMAVVEKPNEKLRICIDPQSLNIALKREHYRLPLLDYILPELHKAQVFSKLDVKHAFWHVKLDDESSKLTKMITAYGRCRCNRLPFGLKVSSEIFQKRLHAALSNLNGVFAIVDDIIVLGCGNTYQEAVLNHDENLKNLRECCQLKF